MPSLTSFETEALLLNLHRIFVKQSFFSICELDRVAHMLDVNIERHPSYRHLRAAHCLHYADMTPHFVFELKRMTVEVLGLSATSDNLPQDTQLLIRAIERGRA